MNTASNVFQSARWVWLPDTGAMPQVNIFALFRTRFTVRHGTEKIPVKLRISVAGNYAAYLNGSLISFGQYTDYPRKKTYSETDLSPFCGNEENELVCQIHFAGNAFSSHLDGQPGMIAEIVQGQKILSASGTDWECCPDSRYAFGERDKISSSLNYTFEFHAGHPPEPWTTPQPVEYPYGVPVLRPVPPSENAGFAAGHLIRSGRLFRGNNTGLSIGETFRNDIPDAARSNGVYQVYDLGKEYTGFLSLRLTAPEGTVIDIAHGEYLENGRLPAYFPAGKRNFTDRYIAGGKGMEEFTHPLRRLGCRYLEIHAFGEPEQIQIHSAGLIRVELPGLATPEFSCGNPFWEQAHEVSAETLRLCLHEKFENCPWREQSICMYDARNQMLFGYPFWGNYTHAAAMLRLFGESLNADGLLSIAVPSAMKVNIPSYTFLWMTALHEYTMYSGDLSLFREYAEQILGMYGKILKWQKNGLYLPPEMEALWNYCEASEMEFCPDPPNAFYNLYLMESLERSADLFRLCGRTDTADALYAQAEHIGKNAEPYYFHEPAGAYADHITPEGVRETFHGHTQALFLAQGLIPPERQNGILNLLKNNDLPFPALGALLYLVKGVFRYGTADDRRGMAQKLEDHYRIMLDAGAKTWWEIIDGKQYAAGAGSLCHGWSAVPAWYESSILLGVTPLEPGFTRFLLKPYAGKIPFADGRIVTPYGTIRVQWQKYLDGLELSVESPRNCIPVPEHYPEDPIRSFRWNGVLQK